MKTKFLFLKQLHCLDSNLNENSVYLCVFLKEDREKENVKENIKHRLRKRNCIRRI